MSIEACRPPCSRSVVTSVSSGSAFRRSTTFGTHSCNASMSEPHSVNWYCESLERPPRRSACAGTRNTRKPGMRPSFGRRRAITCWVLTPRSLSGFSEMNMRPRLTEALKPEEPTEEPRPCTAGSARMMCIALSCSFFMASKEMSVEARVPEKISPESSCGM